MDIDNLDNCEFNYELEIKEIGTKVFFPRRLDKDELELFVLNETYEYYKKQNREVEQPHFCTEYGKGDVLYLKVSHPWGGKRLESFQYTLGARIKESQEITQVPNPSAFLTHKWKALRIRAKIMIHWAPELRRRRELFGGYISPY